ncbi:hypothetical protein [Roseibium algae]|uniref:Uncharacterized protein n=1 Tax=Roseibium algae TaxID=3123038 RepID=A0ABU8TRS4_9HYPH
MQVPLSSRAHRAKRCPPDGAEQKLRRAVALAMPAGTGCFSLLRTNHPCAVIPDKGSAAAPQIRDPAHLLRAMPAQIAAKA